MGAKEGLNWRVLDEIFADHRVIEIEGGRRKGDGMGDVARESRLGLKGMDWGKVKEVLRNELTKLDRNWEVERKAEE